MNKKRILSLANDFVLDNVDSLTYMGLVNKKPKKYTVSPLITIDWKEVLADPPSNTSETTKFEMLYLQEITRNLTAKESNLVEIVDKDFGKPLYREVLGNRQFPESEIESLWDMVDSVIQMLKYKYDRPRPYQLSSYLGINVNHRPSDTHLTPAYPSGHTAYGAIATYYLAALYPELSSELFSIPGQIGLARCLQGVHYPSDNEASMVIVGAIWENIRYKLYPNLIGV